MNRQWLEERLTAGDSYEEIAREARRHPSTVSYCARRHGLASAHVSRHAARGGIDRDTLAALVDEGLSIRAIAERLDLSYTTVRHWLREYALQTRRAHRSKLQANGDGVVGTCPRHGETSFVIRRDGGRWRCLKCRAEAVTRRRQKVKAILVSEAGGRCALCGYNRCVGALGFHHVDPAEKRFGISLRASRSLGRARSEARKCVLLCANCHAEVERGVTRLSFGPQS
jgi:DNA-binding transcriptional ArsR family regulator